MVRPAKIYHTTVVLNEDKVDTFINKIYELGLCQLKGSDIDLSSKYSYELLKGLDEMQTRFNFILDSLEEYREVIQPGSRIKGFFSPEAPFKHKSMLYSTKGVIEEVRYYLDLIEPKILERLDKLRKIKEDIQRKEFIISNLSLIPNIETGFFKSSDNIKAHLGLIASSSLPKIRDELGERGVVGVESRNKTQHFIIVLSSLDESPYIEKVLHNVGFQSLEVPYENKKPVRIIENLRKDIDKLENEKRNVENFSKKTMKVYGKKFTLLSEELEIAKEKIMALQNFKATKAFSVLEAWVPKKDFDKFNEIVREVSKQYYIEIDEKEDAPTLFNNFKWVKPFEMITELYSPPKYNEFDPTILIAITFTLFFGFMLTDAAYGIILVLFAFVMYRGIGKYNEGAKRFATLLIFFGVSTILLGMLFGSYFGDFFHKLGFNVLTPIDPLKEVMLVLTISLALGALHLLAGLVIGFYENVRKGAIKDAFAQQGVWLFFVIGLFLILLKQIPAAIAALIIAVVLQLVFNFIEGGIVTAILSIFSFTGFIGDLFSYARLMALALGTAGIALAVNFMIFLSIDLIPYAGIIIGIVVFIVGHLFNILMNGLGAFIHTTRLHFLELFTKFYDGGGRLYKPFKAERKSTYV